MKDVWEKIVSFAASNFGLKVLAVVIAVGLWVAGHRDVERAVEVPVEFRNIPSDLMVMDNRVDYVILRLTGPRTLVSTLDAGDLRLALDLAGAKPGSLSYPLGPNAFSIPRGVTIARITPPVVHLQLEPVLRRVLPVTVRFVNKPPAGQKIAETLVEPERVSVLGPAEEVRRLVSVETVPIDLEENRSAIKRIVRLSTGGSVASQPAVRPLRSAESCSARRTTRTAATANMPADPIARTTWSASGHPLAAISRGSGMLPVPAASRAPRPRQTAATVRKRGAKTASRPPAPCRPCAPSSPT